MQEICHFFCIFIIFVLFGLQKYAVEFLGNGGLEADGLFRYGMDEGEDLGMETESVDRRGLVTMPILAVADNRTAFGSQMDTDLVGAAGLEMEFDEGILLRDHVIT